MIYCRQNENNSFVLCETSDKEKFRREWPPAASLLCHPQEKFKILNTSTGKVPRQTKLSQCCPFCVFNFATSMDSNHSLDFTSCFSQTPCNYNSQKVHWISPCTGNTHTHTHMKNWLKYSFLFIYYTYVNHISEHHGQMAEYWGSACFAAHLFSDTDKQHQINIHHPNYLKIWLVCATVWV